MTSSMEIDVGEHPRKNYSIVIPNNFSRTVYLWVLSQINVLKPKKKSRC